MLFWGLWECLTILIKIIISIFRKLSCLSVCKKSTSSFISFLRHCKEIEILVPDTQTGNSEDERTDDDTNTIFPEESTTEDNIVEKREESISVLTENKFSSLIQSIEKRFHNIEDKIIGFQNMNLSRNSVNPTTPENNLYVELLKNRISDLEKQLTEKNAIINFLTTQLVTKSQDTSVHNNIRNNKHHRRYKRYRRLHAE